MSVFLWLFVLFVFSRGICVRAFKLFARDLCSFVLVFREGFVFVCFSFLRAICVHSFLDFRVGFVFVCFGFSRGICVGQSPEFLSLERCLLEIVNDHQCASLTTIQSEFARTINVTFGILFREHPKNHRSTLEFVRRQTKFDALIEDPINPYP